MVLVPEWNVENIIAKTRQEKKQTESVGCQAQVITTTSQKGKKDDIHRQDTYDTFDTRQDGTLVSSKRYRAVIENTSKRGKRVKSWTEMTAEPDCNSSERR